MAGTKRRGVIQCVNYWAHKRLPKAKYAYPFVPAFQIGLSRLTIPNTTISPSYREVGIQVQKS